MNPMPKQAAAGAATILTVEVEDASKHPAITTSVTMPVDSAEDVITEALALYREIMGRHSCSSVADWSAVQGKAKQLGNALKVAGVMSAISRADAGEEED